MLQFYRAGRLEKKEEKGGVGWPRPGSGRGKPPLVDEYRACSAGSTKTERKFYVPLPMGPGRFFIGVATQKSQTERVDGICFVSCVKMLSFFSVFVVHLVSHELLFLYSRRSSRRVLHICGIAGDPLVCRSLSPQRTLPRGTSQRLIVQFQHRVGKDLRNS